MTTQKVIPIQHILLHTNPHWDELIALYMLQLYGTTRYPGIDTAQVRYTKGIEPRAEALFDAMKMVLVGCGKGRYDEHRLGLKDADGKSTDRLPGECAATLVCKDLGLMEIPEIKRIAEEVFRCDSEQGVQITEMPSLVKVLHRRLENGDEKVRGWATNGLKAIQVAFSINLASGTGEKTLKEIFNELDAEGRFSEKRTRNSLAQLIDKSQARLTKAEQEHTSIPLFELSFVVAALQRANTIPSAEVHDWVMFPLDHLYADQTEFWKAVDEAKTPRIGRTVIQLKEIRSVKNRDGVKVLVIHSDSPLIASASRRHEVGVDMVIARNSRGNVHVSVDTKSNLYLGNFIRMLRWLELPKDANGKPVDQNGKPVEVTWTELGMEGPHPLVPHIYYVKNSILNGSTTHPDVPPVALCSQALCDIAKCAFSARVIDWMRHHEAPKSEKSEDGSNHLGDTVPEVDNAPPADSATEESEKAA